MLSLVRPTIQIQLEDENDEDDAKIQAVKD